MSFLNPETVGESLISNYNMYLDTGLKKELETKDIALILNHINTKEDYYAIKMPTSGRVTKQTIKDKWKVLIDNPCSRYLRWPIDVIMLRNQYYLIYDIIPVAYLKSVAELSFDTNFLGVDKKNIREIVSNYLEAYLSMSKKSYMYFGLDDDIIYVDPSNNAVMIPVYNSVYLNKALKLPFKRKTYFSEVIDPYSYENRKISDEDTSEDIYVFDSFSEMYAFASHLFRFLIGLYPFEGPTMSEYANNQYSEDNTDWIYHYLQNPYFIFDSESENYIYGYGRYEANVKRWEMLSDELRDMFYNTFVIDSVLRLNEHYTPYSVEEWKKAVENTFVKLDK